MTNDNDNNEPSSFMILRKACYRGDVKAVQVWWKAEQGSLVTTLPHQQEEDLLSDCLWQVIQGQMARDRQRQQRLAMTGIQPVATQALQETSRLLLQWLLQHRHGGDDAKTPNAVLDKTNEDGDTVLHLTCRQGYLSCTQVLLEYHGAAAAAAAIVDSVVNAINARHETPLAIAVSKGYRSVVQCLLAQPDIDPSIPNQRGETPLHVALQQPHHQRRIMIVNDLLLAHHAVNVNAPNPQTGETALHVLVGSSTAPFTSSPQYLQWLNTLVQQHGADVNAVTHRGWTPLHVAVRFRSFTMAQALLHDYHANPNVATHDLFETPLHKACWNDDVVMVRLLLQYGADVNAADTTGRTPLHCGYNAVNVVQVLVDEGQANVNIPDGAGETPLFYCIRQDQMDSAQILLDCGRVQLDWRNQEEGYTILHVALSMASSCCDNVVSVIRSLIQAGASVHAVATTNGTTALHLACAVATHAVVEYLLKEAGARTSVVNAQGMTPLHVACQRGQFAMVQALLQHGAKLDAVDAQGWTALHHGSAAGHVDLVSQLVLTGADLYAQDAHGRTAFDVAGHWLDVRFYFLRQHNWLTHLRGVLNI